PRPAPPPLFPYTTLFRSCASRCDLPPARRDRDRDADRDASPGGGLERPRPAERLDALAYAEQAEAAACVRRIESRAVVADLELESAVRARDRHLRLVGAAMFRDVREAFLDDAIDIDLDRLVEIVERTARGERAERIRMMLVPTVDELLERRREPELVQPSRTQPADDAGDHGVHVARDLLDRRGGSAHGVVPPVAFFRDRYGDRLDRADRLTELVVQLLREMPALAFLDRERSLRELPVLRAAALQRFRHVVELPREHGELGEVERRQPRRVVASSDPFERRDDAFQRTQPMADGEEEDRVRDHGEREHESQEDSRIAPSFVDLVRGVRAEHDLGDIVRAVPGIDRKTKLHLRRLDEPREPRWRLGLTRAAIEGRGSGLRAALRGHDAQMPYLVERSEPRDELGAGRRGGGLVGRSGGDVEKLQRQVRRGLNFLEDGLSRVVDHEPGAEREGRER